MPIWKMGTWLRLLDCDFYSPHAFLPLSLGSCLNFDSFLQVSLYLISSIIFYWTFWDMGAPVLYFLVPVNGRIGLQVIWFVAVLNFKFQSGPIVTIISSK
jgi:hypothetical protein